MLTDVTDDLEMTVNAVFIMQKRCFGNILNQAVETLNITVEDTCFLEMFKKIQKKRTKYLPRFLTTKHTAIQNSI